MAFRKPKKQPQFADLIGILAQTKDTENPLYQVVQEIIRRLNQFQGITVEEVEKKLNESDASKKFATRAASYHTKNDDIAILPNSVQLLAGTGITFNDTVPNKRTISSTGGGSGGTTTIITREIPSGSIDGVNVTFTLANIPIVASEQVFLNGLLQDITRTVSTREAPPVTKWRIYVTEGNYSQAVGITEFEMAGVVGGPNLCSGGISTADSYYNNDPTYSPDKGFDGLLSTRWTTAIGSPPWWLEYQFAMPVSIVEYRIKVGNLGVETIFPKTWKFEYWDGSVWVTTGTEVDQIGWTSNETRTFVSNVTPPVSLNGDYSISSTVITFLIPPVTGDRILVTYQKV